MQSVEMAAPAPARTETGWTCVNNSAMTSTSCTPNCGDGRKVGSEACDDGDTDGDSKNVMPPVQEKSMGGH